MKKTVVRNGKAVVIPDYATVQGILLGAIATFVIFITIIGPEYVPPPPPTLTRLVFGYCIDIRFRNHGSNFEQQQAAFEGGAPAVGKIQKGSDSEEIGEKF